MKNQTKIYTNSKVIMEGRNSIQSFTFATMAREETSTTGQSSLQEPPVVVAHKERRARKDYVPKQETTMTRLMNLQFRNNAWVYGISNSNNVHQWYLKKISVYITAEQVNIFLLIAIYPLYSFSFIIQIQNVHIFVLLNIYIAANINLLC